MAYWIAGRCPPQREVTIAERLEREIGAAVYLPRARMILRRSHRPATLPLFATYFFADLDGSPPWQAIRRQPGVISLVMSGDRPSRCPASEIEKLRASEVGGLVQLANEPPPASDQRFVEGQAVKIRYGSFDGREARYAKPARKNMSIVMVVLLNRVLAVRVPTAALAAIA